VIRFLHTADWQLGMTRHFLDGEAQPRYSADRLEAVAQMGRVAAEQGCAFVLVCGDVFETNLVGRQVVHRTLDALRGFTVPVYLLPGNHDPLDPSSLYRSPLFLEQCPPNVRVLDGSEPIAVAEGVELVAAPWRTRRPTTDLVAQLIQTLPAGAYPQRILAAHGAVDTLSPDAHDPARIGLAEVERALADGRLAYAALGDRHSVTAVGATGRVWYAGTPEPTRYEETDPGHVLLVDLEPDRVLVRPHRVGRWRFLTESAELAGAADILALAERLQAIEDKPRSIVRLVLVGSLTLAESADLELRLEALRDPFASLHRWTRHERLVVVPDLLDRETLALSGFAAQAFDELRERAADGGDAAGTAARALELLYRLARGR